MSAYVRSRQVTSDHRIIYKKVEDDYQPGIIIVYHRL